MEESDEPAQVSWVDKMMEEITDILKRMLCLAISLEI